MKKLIIVLMVVAVTSFLFVGCLTTPDTTTDTTDTTTDTTVPTTVPPIITGIADIVGGYVNAAAALDGIVVIGTAPTYSEVKVYINGITAGTGDAGENGVFTVQVANADLIKAAKVDGTKTLYATATDLGLPESDSSNVRTFILDTETPFILSSSAQAGTGLLYRFVETTDTSNTLAGSLYAPCSVPLLAVSGKFTEVLAAPLGAVVNALVAPIVQIGQSLAAAPLLNPLLPGTINWRIEVISVTGGTGVDSKTVVRVTNDAGKAQDYEYSTGVTSSTSWIEGLDVTAQQFFAATDIGAHVLITTTNTAAVAGWVTVTFNEPVTGASITTGIWTLFGATLPIPNTVSVRSATVARLTENVAGALGTGVFYSVGVTGPEDLAGNFIPLTAPSWSTGVVGP